MKDDDDDLSIMLKIVDALFSSIAERAVAREGVPFEEALEGAWSVYERGLVRLVDYPDRDSLGVEPCESRNERRTAARQNKLLASYRRRLVEAKQREDIAIDRCPSSVED
jgi:hypothetical protein